MKVFLVVKREEYYSEVVAVCSSRELAEAEMSRELVMLVKILRSAGLPPSDCDTRPLSIEAWEIDGDGTHDEVATQRAERAARRASEPEPDSPDARTRLVAEINAKARENDEERRALSERFMRKELSAEEFRVAVGPLL